MPYFASRPVFFFLMHFYHGQGHVRQSSAACGLLKLSFVCVVCVCAFADILAREGAVLLGAGLVQRASTDVARN